MTKLNVKIAYKRGGAGDIFRETWLIVPTPHFDSLTRHLV